MTTPTSFQLIITNFHLYLIQLWWRFNQFFFLRDIVYAQTWEVLTMKNRIEPPYTESPSQPFLVSSRTLKTAATITSVGCYTAVLCLHATLLPTNWGKICIFLKPPYSSVFDHVGVQSVFKDRCKEFT